MNACTAKNSSIPSMSSSSEDTGEFSLRLTKPPKLDLPDENNLFSSTCNGAKAPLHILGTAENVALSDNQEDTDDSSSSQENTLPAEEIGFKILSRNVLSKNDSNNIFQHYRHSRFEITPDDQEKNNPHPVVDDEGIPNAVDEFGGKFTRTMSKIVEKGRAVTEKRKQEKEKNAGSVSNETSNCESRRSSNEKKEGNGIVQDIVKDFSPNGDRKILRAIGRTAAVNAAVLATTLSGGAAVAGGAGFLTGGAITAKRLGDGVQQEDESEVAKSIAVYGCSTTASIVGQAVTGALMVGVAGAALPVAGAVAFIGGCVSGITAGALSEWGVDNALGKRESNADDDKEKEEEENESKACNFDDSTREDAPTVIMDEEHSCSTEIDDEEKEEQKNESEESANFDDGTREVAPTVIMNRERSRCGEVDIKITQGNNASIMRFE